MPLLDLRAHFVELYRNDLSMSKVSSSLVVVCRDRQGPDANPWISHHPCLAYLTAEHVDSLVVVYKDSQGVGANL